MKKMSLIMVILLLGALSSHSVYAHRYIGRGFRVYPGYSGFYAGPSVGFYSGYGFPPPYYAPYYVYPPAISVAPVPPPVYIQRDNAASGSEYPANYWYYCRNPEGYYPYVKECPGGWTQVAPTPPLR